MCFSDLDNWVRYISTECAYFSAAVQCARRSDWNIVTCQTPGRKVSRVIDPVPVALLHTVHSLCLIRPVRCDLLASSGETWTPEQTAEWQQTKNSFLSPRMRERHANQFGFVCDVFAMSHTASLHWYSQVVAGVTLCWSGAALWVASVCTFTNIQLEV